jgi:hypothetical protein
LAQVPTTPLRTFSPVAAGLLALALGVAAVPPARAQAVRGADLLALSPLFPPDNWWNVDVSAAPVDPNSANFLNFIGAGVGLHPDLGGDVDPGDPASPETYGMIYATVPGTQPLEPVTFVEFGDQSDPGAPGRPLGYPIPVEARTQARWIEGGYPASQTGGDRHMLLVDRDNRILYELYHARWTGSRWEAGSGAIYLLDANQRRPETWTSADAAGLAILPGLIRYDEAFGPDPIRHAFRMTVHPTRGYVFPASHDATTSSNANALPMGARLRLKAGKDISGYPPEVRKLFQAMKTYGLIVADNGSDLYITGTHDTRWDNGVLNPAFASLKASDFEVIQLGWRPPVQTATPALRFHTLPPCRLLDTRRASGATGGPALAPGSQRVVTARGICGVPDGARALSVNVTVVDPGVSGHLTFFPGNAEPTNATIVSFRPGVTRANNAVLMLAGSGTETLGVASTAPTAVHLVIDVNGYFQ